MRRARRILAAMTMIAAAYGGMPDASADPPEPAGAETAQACVTAYEVAQLQQRRGELVAARESLRFCARNVCPVVASSDCLQWLGDVERAMPSLVLGAHRGDRDVANVTVWIDGKEVMRQLDGKPIDLDPGSHTFRFVLEGEPPVDLSVLIRAGEKNRPLDVQFKSDAPPSEPPIAAAPEASTSVGEGRRTAALVVGGIGLAALAAGSIFGLRALSKNDEANRVCPSNDCADRGALDANSEARTDANIANVGIGIGVVGLGVATYLFLTSKPGAAPLHKATPARLGHARMSPYSGSNRAGISFSMTW